MKIDATAKRFQFSSCRVDELQKLKEANCPKNTAKNNDQAPTCQASSKE